MTSNALTPAEWKEIEGYLKDRPQCKIDETGVIWMHNADGQVTGALHPRTFLDMAREVQLIYVEDVFPGKLVNEGIVVYRDELATVEEFKSKFTVAGIRAMVKQLRGE